MPIYEYRCTACGHELEALQKITEAPLSSCPACRADALTKLVTAAGFQLKGSGWYATDFRNGSKPAAKSANGEAKADGKTADGKSESSSESKSESSSESKSESSSGSKGESSSESKGESKSAAPAASCGAGCGCH